MGWEDVVSAEPDLFAVTSAAVRADEQRRHDPVMRRRIQRGQATLAVLHRVLTVVAAAASIVIGALIIHLGVPELGYIGIGAGVAVLVLEVLAIVAGPPLSRWIALAAMMVGRLVVAYVAAFPLILVLAFFGMFW
jgi:hypothetical protein